MASMRVGKRRPPVGTSVSKVAPKPPRRPVSSTEAAPGPERPSSLKLPEIVGELEALYKQLGVRVTYEALAGELGSGGICKVKGHWRIIIDRRATPSERAGLLLPLLDRFSLEGMTLSESLQRLLAQVRRVPAASPSTEPPAGESYVDIDTDTVPASPLPAAAI